MRLTGLFCNHGIGRQELDRDTVTLAVSGKEQVLTGIMIPCVPLRSYRNCLNLLQ